MDYLSLFLIIFGGLGLIATAIFKKGKNIKNSLAVNFFFILLLIGLMETPIMELVEQYKGDNSFERAYVERVVDGDTLEVSRNGEKERLRMILVDTPETVHPRKPVEFYGKEASDFTKSKLEDRYVYLQIDTSDTDRYGRLLRYVWLERPSSDYPTDQEITDMCFNAILLKEGYGQVATFPPDVKYERIFLSLEREARDSNRGLWNKAALEKFENQEKKAQGLENVVDPEGLIKGNKNSKIYHMPGSSHYDSVSDKNAVYFESEKDAIEAGYRKAGSN